jgi:hypothetical protein
MEGTFLFHRIEIREISFILETIILVRILMKVPSLEIMRIITSNENPHQYFQRLYQGLSQAS